LPWRGDWICADDEYDRESEFCARYAGGQGVPAGRHVFDQGTDELGDRDNRKGPSVFAIVNAVSTPDGAFADRTKVTLKQEDNGTYDLKDIWLEGQDFGLELE
jgi:hypothetical protein